MKGLSLRQPWAWAISHLPEDIAKRLENRTWRQLRDRFDKIPVQPGEVVALHASKTEPEDFDWDGVQHAIGRSLTDAEQTLIDQQRGCITAVMTIRDVLRTNETQDIVDDGHFPRYVLREGDQQMFVNALGPGAAYDRQLEQIRRWWLGPYAFWVDDVKALEIPIKHQGALMFWEVSEIAVERITNDLKKPTDGLKIPVICDPSLPPGTAEVRSGDQVVRITDIKMGGTAPEPAHEIRPEKRDLVGGREQLSMFGDAPAPKKPGGLH